MGVPAGHQAFTNRPTALPSDQNPEEEAEQPDELQNALQDLLHGDPSMLWGQPATGGHNLDVCGFPCLSFLVLSSLWFPLGTCLRVKGGAVIRKQQAGYNYSETTWVTLPTPNHILHTKDA